MKSKIAKNPAFGSKFFGNDNKGIPFNNLSDFSFISFSIMSFSSVIESIPSTSAFNKLYLCLYCFLNGIKYSS